MLGKNGIFRGKCFEKLFFQKIPRNSPRKITFRGKKCTKNRPQDTLPIVVSSPKNKREIIWRWYDYITCRCFAHWMQCFYHILATNLKNGIKYLIAFQICPFLGSKCH
jgi:hypothetical protein